MRESRGPARAGGVNASEEFTIEEEIVGSAGMVHCLDGEEIFAGAEHIAEAGDVDLASE